MRGQRSGRAAKQVKTLHVAQRRSSRANVQEEGLCREPFPPKLYQARELHWNKRQCQFQNSAFDLVLHLILSLFFFLFVPNPKLPPLPSAVPLVLLLNLHNKAKSKERRGFMNIYIYEYIYIDIYKYEPLIFQTNEKLWKKKTLFHFNVQKLSLKRLFDISEMRNSENTRKKLSCAMFYFECCLVQRDFLLLNEKCATMKILSCLVTESESWKKKWQNGIYITDTFYISWGLGGHCVLYLCLLKIVRKWTMSGSRVVIRPTCSAFVFVL